jgi:hypothetical protein
MKDKIIKYLEPRLFTWSTLIGIIIITFGIYYHQDLNDFIKWFFLVAARQLITNIFNEKSFINQIIGVLVVVIGGLFINKSHKKKTICKNNNH